MNIHTRWVYVYRVGSKEHIGCRAQGATRDCKEQSIDNVECMDCEFAPEIDIVDPGTNLGAGGQNSIV